MSRSFVSERLESRRTRLSFLLVVIGVFGSLSACSNNSQPTDESSGVPISGTADQGALAQTSTETPSGDCISDAAEVPAEFDTNWDLQTNISSYLMSARDLAALENTLESMCGDLWGYEAEPLIADTMVADVNGDDREDLLLSMTLPSGGSLGEAQVYAYVMGGGGFTPYPMLEIRGAGGRTEGLYTGGGGEFLDVVDMNGEGLPEIVFAVHWDSYSEYFIANWSELDVLSLIHYVDDLGMERTSILVQAGTATIRDEDRDGLLDLVIERQAADGQAWTEIWSWDGAFFSVSDHNGPSGGQTGPPVVPTWTPIADIIQPIPAGSEVTITSIHMVDEMNGWAIGNAGDATDHIFYTDHLGLRWQDRTPPEAVGMGIASGFFLDGDYAWIAYSPGPLVWRTSDGGLTWSHSAQPAGNEHVIVLNDDYGAEFFFADPQHGWLMASLDAGMSKVYMALYRTTDGGENWEALIHPTTNPVLQTGTKTGMFFFNAQVGWVTRDTDGVIDGAFVDWTHDGGETWEMIPIPIPDIPEGVIYYCSTHSPLLFSEQSGALGLRCPYLGEGSEVLWAHYLAMTEDEGRTWTLRETPAGELVFLDRDSVLVVGDTIYLQDLILDGTINIWTPVYSESIWDGDYSFVDRFNFWAVGRRFADNSILLVRSWNGGRTWHLIEPTVVSP